MSNLVLYTVYQFYALYRHEVSHMILTSRLSCFQHIILKCKEESGDKATLANMIGERLSDTDVTFPPPPKKTLHHKLPHVQVKYARVLHVRAYMYIHPVLLQACVIKRTVHVYAYHSVLNIYLVSKKKNVIWWIAKHTHTHFRAILKTYSRNL